MTESCSPSSVFAAGVVGFLLGLALGNGWIT